MVLRLTSNSCREERDFSIIASQPIIFNSLTRLDCRACIFYGISELEIDIRTIFRMKYVLYKIFIYPFPV